MITDIVTNKIAPNHMQQALAWGAKVLEYSKKKYPNSQISLLRPITGANTEEMVFVVQFPSLSAVTAAFFLFHEVDTITFSFGAANPQMGASVFCWRTMLLPMIEGKDTSANSNADEVVRIHKAKSI